MRSSSEDIRGIDPDTDITHRSRDFGNQEELSIPGYSTQVKT